jgi:predicted dehydrogenase
VAAARDRGRAETFARTYRVERVVDSYADLVADPEVDVVYNPAGQHVSCTMKPGRHPGW